MMEHQDPGPAPIGPELRRYGRIVYRQRWWVIGTALITMVASLAITMLRGGDVATDQPVVAPTIAPAPIPSASPGAGLPITRVFIRPPSANENQPAIDINTHAALMVSTEVARAVRDRLELDASTGEILERVRVVPQPPGQILHISYDDPEGELAGTVARSFAVVYLEALEEEDRRRLRQEITLLKRQTRALQNSVSSNPAVLGRIIGLQEHMVVAQTNLRHLDRGYIVESETPSPAASVSEDAAPAGTAAGTDDGQAPEVEPSGTPGLKRNGLAGLILGLLLGLGIAAARETLDESLRTQRAAEQTLDIPVLLRYPRVPDLEDAGFARVLPGVLRLMGERKLLLVTGFADDSVITQSARAISQAAANSGVTLELVEDASSTGPVAAQHNPVVVAAPEYSESLEAVRLASQDTSVLLVIDGPITRGLDVRRALTELRLAGAVPIGVFLYRAEDY